jgi:hypothetical protein
MFKSVVLPHPDGPTTLTISPLPTEKLIDRITSAPVS